MDLPEFTAAFSDFSWAEYFTEIKPLVLLVLGVVIYSIFIFKFYRFLAKRDFLKLELHKHARNFGGALKNFLHILLYILDNIILIPILVFIWFAVLALLLLLLSKTHTPQTVLVTAVALVAAVRITSYYSEDLSRDVAKIVPFTLLGVFLIDYITGFSFQSSLAVAGKILALWQTMLYYLIFVVLVEIVMRVIQLIVSLGRGDY